MTECNDEQLQFHGLGRRTMVARFDGGALLLREVEARTGLLAAVAEHFTDHRDPELIEHTAGDLVCQRIMALALGYADLNDRDRLHYDPCWRTRQVRTTRRDEIAAASPSNTTQNPDNSCFVPPLR